MSMGVKPQDVLREYIGDDLEIPEWDDLKLWRAIISMMVEPDPRSKLSHINTLQDVVDLLNKCQNIMVLTGAGVRGDLWLVLWGGGGHKQDSDMLITIPTETRNN